MVNQSVCMWVNLVITEVSEVVPDWEVKVLFIVYQYSSGKCSFKQDLLRHKLQTQSIN